MAVRWANVPIPEPYVAALVGAALMGVVAPIRKPVGASTARLVGGPMLASGIAVAAWAVISAGDADVERDSELVTTGAYAYSRNPMYVGWAVAVAGVAALRRDSWLVVGWLLATRAISEEVRREEQGLRERFGAKYSAYSGAVPRYVGPLGRRPR